MKLIQDFNCLKAIGKIKRMKESTEKSSFSVKNKIKIEMIKETKG